jgi:hypothetical protein
MAKTRMKVEGFKETLDALRGFATDATARNVIRKSLVDGLKPMATVAAGKAPRAAGDLANSIHVSTKQPSGDPSKVAYGQTLRATGSKEAAAASMRAIRRAEKAAQGGGKPPVYAFMGPEQKQRQAIPQEFGTVNHGPQPFIRPAWDEGKMGTLEIIREAFTVQVEKARARNARKVARLAAKMGR